MRTVRTLSLELVRHGPPHNQLLSPLTEYLALCGNHGAVSLYLPFEHHQFMLMLQRMRYQEENVATGMQGATRAAQLQQLSQIMGDLLAAVPGLTADLGNAPREADELIHLQLVISASELALLPFEAALSPPGCPGAGEPIVLQLGMPISITRQIRRAFASTPQWPTEPRILVVLSDAGNPPEMRFPASDHVEVIRYALTPWVRPLGVGDRRSNVEQLMTVLADATLDDVRAACAKQPFTHVHIVAHGSPLPVLGGDRFGLAFHAKGGGVDLVDGARLAQALRAHQPLGNLSFPTMVTIASCDSGNVSSVIAPGASVAHELHRANIPFVVASQFPLTTAGSLVLTRVLYEELLWGGDPRHALHHARQQLKQLEGEYHDWASVVAYATLPPDLDAQLERVARSRAQAAAEAAFHRIEVLLKAAEQQEGPSDQPVRSRRGPPLPWDLLPPGERRTRQVETELERLSASRDRLLARIPNVLDRPRRGADLYARCGSIEKRRAQLIERLRGVGVRMNTKESGPSEYGPAWDSLSAALRFYELAVEVEPTWHWPLINSISLRWILDGSPLDMARWFIAYQSAGLDLTPVRRPGDFGQRPGDDTTRVMRESLSAADGGQIPRGALAEQRRLKTFWAHASLAELLLLRYCAEGEPALDTAIWHAEQLSQLYERNTFPIASARRQFARYGDWWNRWKQGSPDSERMVSGSRQLLEVIPEPTIRPEPTDDDE